MHDADRRRAVRGGDLALEHDAADLPAPARHAVGEVERGEQLVAARVDRAVPPLVGREPDAGVAEDEDRIERGEAEHAAARAVDRDDEQPVVAPRAEPRDGAHRVAADAVGDEPLARRRLVERAAHLRPEADRHASRLLVGARHQLAERRQRDAAGAQDQLGDETRPAGLMARAEPGAVVAVEVLVEEDVVLPGRVGLEPLDPAEARPPSVLADEEERDQPLAEVGGDLVERELLPEPVGYSTLRSSPKKRA